MNGSIPLATAAPKESQTDTQLYALAHSIDRLHERMSELENRLAVVLSNHPVAVGPQEAKDPLSPLCELAAVLRERSTQVNNAADRVDALLRRLEL